MTNNGVDKEPLPTLIPHDKFSPYQKARANKRGRI